MHYQFVTEKPNYEDYAAGRVILARSGSTSFPVRLASEIFQRSAQFFSADKRLRVYDPCCGSGYLLSILGFLHGNRIESLYGSDIDADSVAMASDNLHLLTAEGLESRKENLEQLASTYSKSSHRDALESVMRLSEKIPSQPIDLATWHANALEQSAESKSVDLIIFDVPYGDVTAWQDLAATDDPIEQLLSAQYAVLDEGGIIVAISDKKQKAAHPRYAQLQHETIGKRRFVILQKN